MKFKVKGSDLSRVLKTVIKGYDSKEDNSYIAFEIDENEGKLIATSRSRAAFFKGSVPAFNIEIDEEEPRAYHLDGVKLRQLVTILPAAPVDVFFEISDKTRSFTIKTITSKYRLPVLSDTPLAPTPKVREYATVDANEFMNISKDLLRIVSTDPSTQEHQISCMRYNLTENALKALATDSYALGSVAIESSLEDLAEDKDVLIRHTEVSALMGTFAQGETLTLVGSNEMFGYVDESGTLSLVGVINMEPLDTTPFESIVNDDNKVVVDKGELKSAIETVAKLSPNDESLDMTLEAGNELLRISNRSGDKIDVRIIESEMNAPGVASFATSVLLKALTPASNGPLRIELGDLTDGSPGIAKIVTLHADGSDNKNVNLIATRMER